MPRSRLAHLCRVLFAACAPIALVSLAPAAAGSEVPVSALSSSLGMDPILVRYPSLVFQLPQTACDFPAQAFGFVDGAGSGIGQEYGLGVIARPGRSALFALAQPASWSNGWYGPSFYTRSVQAGWGTRAGRWRFGAALRGSQARDEEESSTTDEDYDGGERLSGSGLRSRLTRMEAALGTGVRTPRLDLDLAFELRRHDQTMTGAALDVQSSHKDTVGLGMETDGDVAPAAIARARFRACDGTELVLAGEWNEFRASWSGWHYRASHEYSDVEWEAARIAFDEYGRRWFAGGALSSTMRRIDRITVSASYAEERQPYAGVSSYYPARTWTRTRTGAAAFSLRHEIARNLDAQAGLRVAYTDWRERRVSERPDYLSVGTDSGQGMNETFSMGLSYSWKRMRLAAALNTPPQIGRPFALFDVRLLL